MFCVKFNIFLLYSFVLKIKLFYKYFELLSLFIFNFTDWLSTAVGFVYRLCWRCFNGVDELGD